MSNYLAFDSSAYLKNNPDVLLAVLNGVFPDARTHFEQFGVKELRNPNAVVNLTYILTENADAVLGAIQSGAAKNVFDWYANVGVKTGVAPNAELATFDSAKYLADNLDVKAAVEAGVFSSALEHYLAYGRDEKRPAFSTDGAPVDQPAGDTYTLTKGLDNVPGTSGNDTIVGSIDSGNAELNTISPIDVINGGKGIDTFKIAAATAIATTDLPTISNVEIIEISANKTVAVDASGVEGLTNLNLVKAGATSAVSLTAATSTDINVTMKAVGAGVDVAGGKNVTVKLTDVADAADVVKVGVGASVDPAGDVAVTVTGKAYTTATTPTSLGDIEVTGGKTITVTQKAAADTSAAAADKSAVTITQGDVTIIGNADTTTVSVKQDAEVAADNAADTTGGVTETASVKFGALKQGDALEVAGLTFTAAVDMSAADVANAFANLTRASAYAAPASILAGDTQSGGAAGKGTYTGVATGWISGAANGDTVVFTSTTANSGVGDLSPLLTNPSGNSGTPVVTTTPGKAHDAGAAGGVMGVTAGAVSITDAAAAIKTITIDGVGAAGASTTATSVLETLNLSNVAGGATVTVADTAATAALNLEKVGTSTADAAVTITTAPTTLNVKSTGNNYVGLTAALTETLNVSGTGVLDIDANDLAALKTVKVTETAGLKLNAGVADTVTSVDTTGTTGAVTVTIDSTNATYAGGAGKDSVTLSNTTAATKVIDLGAGDDTLKLANNTTAVPTVEVKGGEGTDTLSMTTASAVSFGGATTFAGKISGFERLTINDSAATAAVNVENLGFNYVTTAGSAGTLTLNNLANDSTVVLTAAGNVTANIKNATETANTSDVLNAVARVDSANITFGTLTAAGVETINLTAQDTAGAINKSTLTLAADKATTINLGTSNAALDLTLSPATTKVTLIDGSSMTGALTVQAVGATSTVIKGGSGNDVLKASQAIVSTVNATGATGTPTTTTTANNAVAEVQRLTITADGADDNNETLTVTFGTNGVGGTGSVEVNLTSVDVTDAGAVAAAVVSALNSNGAFSTVALAAIQTGHTDVVEITYLTAGTNITGQVSAVAGGTFTVLAGAGSTAITGATAVQQVTSVVLTDGTVTTGLSTGDIMSIVVGGTTFSYTANATTTMDDAANGLKDLIDADARFTAAYDGNTDTLTITAATAGSAGAFTVSGYTVTDASDVAAAADKLYGGAGNDVLVANALMTEMWGGDGNDVFVVNTASFNVNSYSTIHDFSAGDLIKIDGISAFKSAKVELGATAGFQDFANAAMTSLGLGQAGWFQFGGDTYIVADMGTDSTTAFVNGTDYIVKLTGLVDLSTASFNNTYDSISL